MKDAKDKERLDKVLSNNGFGSRKMVRHLIRSGAVSVNGKTELLPDAHVSVTLDKITVDGEEQRGGSYGGPESSARRKPQRGDGSYWFSGSGILRVNGVADGAVIVFR